MIVRVMDRREFLRVAGGAGGGLILAVYLPDLSELWNLVGPPDAAAAPPEGSPSLFLTVGTDGTVTVTVTRSEMGQGVRTGMPAIVAEELDVPWDSVRVVQADGDERYGHQLTGGSLSVRVMWDPLRIAGATARLMLMEAAARAWGVPRGECATEAGEVRHAATGRSTPYAELAEAAAEVPVPAPETVETKGEEAPRRIVGTELPRVDDPDFVTGRAVFGLDARVPGMRHVAVARCPWFGGSVAEVDDSEARKVPGVTDVVRVPGSNLGFTWPAGVAVVADNTWAALRGKERLRVQWDQGPNASASTDDLRATFRQLAADPGEVLRNDGDVEAALASAERIVEATYELPFLAHATMEPMNCIVDVRPDSIEVTSPTQAPQEVQQALSQMLQLPLSAVTVHVTLIGGGFGRRLYPDMEIEGALVSRTIGAPVQIVWSREDDVRFDRFRPASHHVLRGGVDAQGLPTAWHWKILNTYEGRFVQDDFPAFAVPNVRVEYRHVPWVVPRGAWRATVYSQNPFVIQGFLDELAEAGGQDPMELRLRLLRERPRPDSDEYEHARMLRVLEEVADRSGWRTPPPPGVGRGVAFEACYGSYVAEVAEVRMDGRVPRVQKVTCVLDCGRVVNPDLVRAQVEGGIAFGLAAALHQEITLKDGNVEQDNFDGYPLLRAGEMPEVEVFLIESRARPGGMGETALPPIAPAVAGAVFRASGRKVRRLPMI